MPVRNKCRQRRLRTSWSLVGGTHAADVVGATNIVGVRGMELVPRALRVRANVEIVPDDFGSGVKLHDAARVLEDVVGEALRGSISCGFVSLLGYAVYGDAKVVALAAHGIRAALWG